MKTSSNFVKLAYAIMLALVSTSPTLVIGQQGGAASAKAESVPLTLAIFDFKPSTPDLDPLGPALSDTLNALLANDFALVERQELNKVLNEAELSLSGTVDSASAVLIGKLTGAKVLIAGRIFTAGNELVGVAKIIGTETSRIYGEMASIPSDGQITALATVLAEKLSNTIKANSDSLTVKHLSYAERLSNMQKSLQAKKLPSLMLIDLAANVPQSASSAAVAEMRVIFKDLGFNVVELDAGEKATALKVELNATSELGLQKGNLFSAIASVQIRIINMQLGSTLVATNQTARKMDLGKGNAQSQAIKEAVWLVVEKILPEL